MARLFGVVFGMLWYDATGQDVVQRNITRHECSSVVNGVISHGMPGASAHHYRHCPEEEDVVTRIVFVWLTAVLFLSVTAQNQMPSVEKTRDNCDKWWQVYS